MEPKRFRYNEEINWVQVWINGAWENFLVAPTAEAGSVLVDAFNSTLSIFLQLQGE